MTPTLVYLGVFIILIIILVFAFTMNSDSNTLKISFSQCTSEEAKQELFQELTNIGAEEIANLFPTGICLNNFILIFLYFNLFMATNENFKTKHFAKFTNYGVLKKALPKTNAIEEIDIPDLTFIVKNVAIGGIFVNVSINLRKYYNYLQEQLGYNLFDDIDDIFNLDVTKINDKEITYDSNENIYKF